MGATIVNWGLAVALLGSIILVGAALQFDPVKAFRVKDGDLEIAPQLFTQLARRLKWNVLSGVCVLGVGTFGVNP